ncbi:MAG TPA: phosphoserine phosphatase SerB [Acidimicrobiales bacterium]|nr:phosphoserine phosphatase SerB [Acidimicrobiales bacterium]
MARRDRAAGDRVGSDRAGGESLVVTVSGPDRPGISVRIFERLSWLGLDLVDVEQVQVHGRLLLCLEVGAPADAEAGAVWVRESVEEALGGLQVGGGHLQVVVTRVAGGQEVGRGPRQLVTVLAPRLPAAALGGVFGRIAAAGGNVDRIVRLSRYPVTSYQLVVSGGDAGRLRRELAAEAARQSVDVAVQGAGLYRRAKHLIVLDADSTLLQGEVIDGLAERAGCAEEVAAVTAAAMAGEVDFAEAMDRRLALLAGLDAAVLDEVAGDLVLAPGARTLVRTLKRLGYVTAVVSGGFVQVLEGLAADLGVDHVAANVLEVEDGRLTGRLVGPMVDRAGKAAALARFAEAAGVPLSQTVAVGDGANDLDMLAAAGLGIAFNAKPAVRDAADATLNVPYLDAILFLLGLSRDEIEAADDRPA